MKVYKNREKVEKMVSDILAKVDTNESGKIDFTEFIVAGMS